MPPHTRRLLVHERTLSNWNVRADSVPTPRLLDLGAVLRSAEQAVARALASLPRLSPAAYGPLFAALITLCSDAAPRRRARRRHEPKPPHAAKVKHRSIHGSIRPRHPNHFWIGDFTVFTRFGMPDLYLGALLDAYSRKILAWQLYLAQPSSEHARDLFRRAVSRYGRPENLVSDHGGQFQGEPFVRALTEVGTVPRLGAVGQQGSIALIERFWLTAKTLLDVESAPPLVPELLDERIDQVVHFYNRLRPTAGCPPTRRTRRSWPVLPHARSSPCLAAGQESLPRTLAIRFATVGGKYLPYLERVA